MRHTQVSHPSLPRAGPPVMPALVWPTSFRTPRLSLLPTTSLAWSSPRRREAHGQSVLLCNSAATCYTRERPGFLQARPSSRMLDSIWAYSRNERKNHPRRSFASLERHEDQRPMTDNATDPPHHLYTATDTPHPASAVVAAAAEPTPSAAAAEASTHSHPVTPAADHSAEPAAEP